MQKLSSFFTNKKALLLFFLLAIILIFPSTIKAVDSNPLSGVVLPGTQTLDQAAGNGAGNSVPALNDLANGYNAGNNANPGTNNVVTREGGPAGTSDDFVCDKDWGWGFTGLGKSVLAGLVDFTLITTKLIADTTTALSEWVITSILPAAITNPTQAGAGIKGVALAFTQGWASTRSLANMLIVLAFVVIGIATALRLKEYEAKKALLPLIIVAILINFSGLFCGLIIDASRLTTSGLLNTPNGTTKDGGMNGQTFLQQIERAEAKSACDQIPDHLALYATIKIMFSSIYLVLAVAFLYLAVILLARYAILGILFMLSPLAFACWGIPFSKAKELWKKWWTEFLKWAFVGVSICFFLNIAGAIITSGSTNIPPLGSNANFGTITATAVQLIEYYGVAIAIMCIGINISSKSNGIAAAVSGAIMAAVTGGAGLAMGAVGQLASRTKIGQSMKERGANTRARVAETLGFAPEGHAAQQKAKREKEAGSQIEALRTSSASGDKARYEELVKNGRGAMGSAAIAAANEHGDLAKLLHDPTKTTQQNLQKIEDRTAYARAFGHERSEFEKKDYRLKEFDEKAVQRVVDTRGVDQDTAKRIVRQEQLATNIQAGMSAGEAGRIDHNDIDITGGGNAKIGEANHEFLKENFTPRLVKQIGLSDNKDLIKALEKHVDGDPGLKKDAADTDDQAESTRLTKLADAIDRMTQRTTSRPSGGGGTGSGGPTPTSGSGGGGTSSSGPAPTGGGGRGTSSGGPAPTGGGAGGPTIIPPGGSAPSASPRSRTVYP